MAQAHTFQGARGEYEIAPGLKMRDLYLNLLDRLYYARPHVEFDIDAVCQQFCCKVEEKLGIYPNVARPDEPDAGREEGR